MSRPVAPTPARPFASIFFTDEEKLKIALYQMDASFGERCFTSDAKPFTRTDYYVPEMGSGIRRIFVAWQKLVDPYDLVKMKLEAWKIEDELLGERDGKRGHELVSCPRPAGRPVNIDPGLIAEGHLVLATGKPTHHRPYLGCGVYVDLTLIYERKSFRPLPWTYPDYSEPEIIEMLNALRAQYMRDLRAAGAIKSCVDQFG